jgi:hypothetical protein
MQFLYILGLGAPYSTTGKAMDGRIVAWGVVVSIEGRMITLVLPDAPPAILDRSLALRALAAKTIAHLFFFLMRCADK